VVGVALGVLGCGWVIGDTPQSTVHPASEAARQVQGVYKTMTVWILAIFVVVEGLLVWMVLRYRRKPGQEGVPEQIHGNTPLEIGWTLVPLVIVIALAFPTLRTTCALARPAAPDALSIKVTGKQWWWEVEYPEQGIVTANEIHVPLGRMVNLDLSSDNVIHSFWVPRLSGKRDLVPGRGQTIWFTPEQPGWYEGQCAELCGASHSNMRFRVKVDTAEEFAAWVARQKQPAGTSMTDPGFQAFLGAGCIACHRIEFPGSPAIQRIGPNLTHVGSRTTIAAALLENNRENLAVWIREPERVKPGSLMPNLNLSDEQTATLVGYLQNLQ
jgi:cytochrome c oxidase subunit 2